MSVLPYPGGGGGGWVWQNFRVGGCPTSSPPRVGWDFVGALGSIELVPLLSFFCCRFRVTCLLHITCACPMPIKGLGCFVVCAGCEGGNARTPQFLCLPHAHKGARMLCRLCWSWVRGWVGGWVGVRPPPGGGGFVGLWVCQNSGWVGP